MKGIREVPDGNQNEGAPKGVPFLLPNYFAIPDITMHGDYESNIFGSSDGGRGLSLSRFFIPEYFGCMLGRKD